MDALDQQETSNIQPQYSPEKYDELCEELDRVLYLATAILESSASLDWLYYLLYSPRRSTPTVHNGQPVTVFGPNHTLLEARHRLAKAALERLAKSLHFVIVGPGKTLSIKGSNGLTEPSLLEFENGINITDDLDTPKPSNEIPDQQGLFNKIAELRSLVADNTSQIKLIHFKIAATFIHEIIRAAGNANNSMYLLKVKLEAIERDVADKNKSGRIKREVIGNEPFVGNENVVELGYSFEMAMFGGVIQWDNNGIDAPLFLIKLPTFLTHRDDLPIHSDYKATATCYPVSMHVIRNVHRQEFWDNVQPWHTSALYIKNIVELRRTNFVTGIDPEWSASESSKGKWPNNPCGHVLRAIGHGHVADPSASGVNERPRESMQRKHEKLKAGQVQE